MTLKKFRQCPPGVHADALLVNRRRRVQSGTGVAARRGVTSFFSICNACLQTGRVVTANIRCMLYFTVPCACELYRYVTPEKVSSSE